MNYTQHFSDNVTIFDGTKKKLVYKVDFKCTIESLKFDLTGEIQSSIICFNKNDVKINIGDLLVLQLENLIVVGKIREIKTNEDDDKIVELSFVSNGDLIDYDFVVSDNKYTFDNLVFSDYNASTISVNLNEVATTSESTISLSTALRQIRRKKYITERVEIVNDEIIINYDYNSDNDLFYKLGETDIELTDKVVDFASDTYNLLYLYNQDKITDYNVFYLKPNGEVVNYGKVQFPYQLPDPIGEPYIPKYELVEATNWNNLSFARSKMKEQEYNNKIEFTIPRKNNLEIFEGIPLGKKIEFYTKNGNMIKSIISFIEIKESVVNVILGITRTKFSDQKRKDVV